MGRGYDKGQGSDDMLDPLKNKMYILVTVLYYTLAVQKQFLFSFCVGF